MGYRTGTRPRTPSLSTPGSTPGFPSWVRTLSGVLSSLQHTVVLTLLPLREEVGDALSHHPPQASHCSQQLAPFRPVSTQNIGAMGAGSSHPPLPPPPLPLSLPLLPHALSHYSFLLQVFSKETMEAFVVRHILPKLAYCLQTISINPHHQDIGKSYTLSTVLCVPSIPPGGYSS